MGKCDTLCLCLVPSTHDKGTGARQQWGGVVEGFNSLWKPRQLVSQLMIVHFWNRIIFSTGACRGSDHRRALLLFSLSQI
jgi:hypothetical protein